MATIASPSSTMCDVASMAVDMLDAVWSVIDDRLDEVAALVPDDIARSFDAQADPDELVPKLFHALRGRVPEVEVPGLTPGIADALASSTRIGPLGVTLHVHQQWGVLARCEGLATHLAEQLSVRPGFRQEITGDTRVWAAHQVSRFLALGVLTSRASHMDLSRQSRLEDPEGLRAGLTNGIRLAAKWSLITSGPGQPRTPQPVDHQPQGYRGLATVENHQWALVESGRRGDDLPDDAFGENGLVCAIPGGVAVRTGLARGRVFVTLTMADTMPADSDRTWSEIVDLSFRATMGGAAIVGMPRGATALTPGDYRARVMARRRDEADDPDGVGGEEYDIVVWPGAPQPTHVLAAADRLGHLLRGAAAPIPAPHPETAYRWVDRFLEMGATITVASGITEDEFIRAFGGDPSEPARVRDPWDADQVLLVGSLGDGVVAIESNGWQGNRPEVLRRVSLTGRAASVYWNVNAVKNFSAAEKGVVLNQIEYWSELTDPLLLELSDDLDRDTYVDSVARGLVVAERFTGVAVTEDFAVALRDAWRGYDLLPQLPDHHPFDEHGDYTFGSLLDRRPGLLAATADELRDLSWWIVSEVVKHYEVDDPDVTATMQTRRLSPEAVRRARESQVFTYSPTGTGSPTIPWLTLHDATNPDPLAALLAVARPLMWPQPWQAPILETLRARLDQIAEE